MYEAMIITTVIAIISSASFAIIHWQRFKAKFSQVRHLINLIDDSLYDDSISNKEFEAIWESVKAVLNVEKEEE